MLTLQKCQHSVSGSISRLFAAASTYSTHDHTSVVQFRLVIGPTYVFLGDTAQPRATGPCRPKRRYHKHCSGWPWRKSLVELEDAISLHIPLGGPGDVIVIISFCWENGLFFFFELLFIVLSLRPSDMLREGMIHAQNGIHRRRVGKRNLRYRRGHYRGLKRKGEG